MSLQKVITWLKTNRGIELCLTALLLVVTVAFCITLYTAPRESLGLFLVVIFLVEFFVITKLWQEIKGRLSLKDKRLKATKLSLGYFFIGTFLTTAFLVADIITYEVNGADFLFRVSLKSTGRNSLLQSTFALTKIITLTLAAAVLLAALVYAAIIYVLASFTLMSKTLKPTFLNWESLKRFFVLFLSALIHVVVIFLPIFVIALFWVISEDAFIYTPIIVFPFVPVSVIVNYYLAQRMYPWIMRYFLTKIQ